MLFLSAYILFIYVCMYVWLCWVFVSVRGLSLVVASGGHSSSRCAGHSSSRCAGLSLSRPLVAEHRLQTRRLINCGSRAELLRGMWDLPRPGLEPASPALAGRFSTTAPPGKPLHFFFLFYWSIVDLQCCVHVCCTAEWLSYIYIPFHILFHYGLSQDIEYIDSFLCSTVETCCLSMLCILVCVR